MKKLAWLLLLVPFFAFKCEKETYGWLEGKVVRFSCASYVIQVTNNNSIGEDGWKDMFDNNKTYDNAIAAANKCDIPESIVKGNKIRFRIESSNNPAPCAVCFMYDAPPKVEYEIKDIEVVK